MSIGGAWQVSLWSKAFWPLQCPLFSSKPLFHRGGTHRHASSGPASSRILDCWESHLIRGQTVPPRLGLTMRQFQTDPSWNLWLLREWNVQGRFKNSLVFPLSRPYAPRATDVQPRHARVWDSSCQQRCLSVTRATWPLGQCTSWIPGLARPGRGPANLLPLEKLTSRSVNASPCQPPRAHLLPLPPGCHNTPVLTSVHAKC